MSKNIKLDVGVLMRGLYRCGWFAGAMYATCYTSAGFIVASTDLHWMGNALVVCTGALTAHLGRGIIASHYIKKVGFEDVED